MANMISSNTLPTLLCILLASAVCKGQAPHIHDTQIKQASSFVLTGMGGKKETVLISNDYDNNRVKIIGARDSICLADNHYGELSAKLVTKNFLQISYAGQGGGSGRSYSWMALVCVDEGRPHVALTMVSDDAFSMGTPEEHDYFEENFDSKIKVVGEYPTKLGLILKYHYSSGKDTAIKTKDYRKTIALQYDNQLHVFYQKQDEVDKTVSTGYPTVVTIKLKGKYPALHIGTRYNYDFADGNWYVQYSEKKSKDFWSAITTPCR